MDDAVAVFTRELLRIIKVQCAIANCVFQMFYSPVADATMRQCSSGAVGTPMAEAKRDACARILREKY